jgi:hypothetical protein
MNVRQAMEVAVWGAWLATVGGALNEEGGWKEYRAVYWAVDAALDEEVADER